MTVTKGKHFIKPRNGGETIVFEQADIDEAKRKFRVQHDANQYAARGLQNNWRPRKGTRANDRAPATNG